MIIAAGIFCAMHTANGRVCGIVLFIASLSFVHPKVIQSTTTWTWRRQITHDDKLPPDADMTSAINTATRRQCALSCLTVEWCNTFFYHGFEEKCLHHRMTYIASPNGWGPSPGLRYYRLESASACPRDKNYVIDRPTSTCYRLDLSLKNWVNALDACADNNETLVVLEPVEKASFIESFIRASRDLTVDGVYIGAKQLPGVSDIEWINGEPVNITATRSLWVPTTDFTRVEPDGIILLRRIKNFQWSIARSHFEIHFICERPFE
ncbi:uncharacterized protein [Littorina saxatilis]|uniref:uncharacterized protein n=1 Tax=Littorina saxatilis TaxID=31220 RepID=UPI0038B43583